MFYVCKGSCLCGTVSNRGKVIYCYGDLVPRHDELFEGKEESGGRATQRDLLAAQLCIWVFGLLALLIVLLLIRKSITSLRSHIKKVTERLPWYHDDESLGSPISPLHSPTMDHKDSTMVDSVIRNEAATASNTSGSLAEEEPDEYCENFCICDYFFSISPSPCAPASMNR